MWIFGIWILLLSESALGNDTFCMNDSYTTCAPPNTFPLSIPENEIALDESCSIVSEYMICVKNHEITCKGSFKYDEQFNRVYGTLTRMCDEGSAFHKELGSNIKCIKRILKNQSENCLEGQKAVVHAYKLYLGKEFEKETEELTPEELYVLFCLEHSFEIGCFLRNVEECGVEAKNVCLEIINTSGFILDGCPGDSKKTSLFLLRYLELDYYPYIVTEEILLMIEQNK